MSLIDEAREVKDWINSDDDPCDTGDLEPELVLRMCNHIIAKPKKSKKTAGVWQITEERVGLLRYCLETLLDAPDIEEIPGPGHSIEMLRAMLKEAE